MTDRENRRLAVLAVILAALAGLLLLILIVGAPMVLVAVHQAREAARREQGVWATCDYVTGERPVLQ